MRTPRYQFFFLPFLGFLLLPALISCGSNGGTEQTNPGGADAGSEGGAAPPGLEAADLNGFWFGRLQGVNPDCVTLGTPLFYDIEISFGNPNKQSEGSDIYNFAVDHLEAEVEIVVDCPGDVFFTDLFDSSEDPSVDWDSSTGLLSIRYLADERWLNRTNVADNWTASAYLGIDLILKETGELEVVSGEVTARNNREGIFGRAELLGQLNRL